MQQASPSTRSQYVSIKDEIQEQYKPQQQQSKQTKLTKSHIQLLMISLNPWTNNHQNEQQF